MVPFSLSLLRDNNRLRNAEWDKERQIGVQFRALELAGEVGELLNVIKKIERTRMGMQGSKATFQQLTDEIGDVLISLDSLAGEFDIHLEPAVVHKFNETSFKHGFETVFR